MNESLVLTYDELNLLFCIRKLVYPSCLYNSFSNRKEPATLIWMKNKEALINQEYIESNIKGISINNALDDIITKLNVSDHIIQVSYSEKVQNTEVRHTYFSCEGEWIKVSNGFQGKFTLDRIGDLKSELDQYFECENCIELENNSIEKSQLDEMLEKMDVKDVFLKLDKSSKYKVILRLQDRTRKKESVEGFYNLGDIYIKAWNFDDKPKLKITEKDNILAEACRIIDIVERRKSDG